MVTWIEVPADGVRHLWRLGDVADSALEDQIFRAHVVLGLQASVEAVVHFGEELHPKLLALVTVRDVAELARVSPEALETFRGQAAAASRATKLAAARRVVAELHPDDKATLRGEIGSIPAPNPTGRV